MRQMIGMLILLCTVTEAFSETNSLGMQLIPVNPGTFSMGALNGDWDEKPVHEVRITQPFAISEREVTLNQFQQFRPDHRHASPTGAAVAVCWNDAVAFCEWLSAREGITYRLPTEAEWEYTCHLNGGGPGDAGLPVLIPGDTIKVESDAISCMVFSRTIDAGETTLHGNDRSHTGSSGSFIPIIMPSATGCVVSATHGPLKQPCTIVEATPGVKPYNDRGYTLKTIDDRLRGGLLIQTPVSDENSNDEQYLVINTSTPATLFLVFNTTTMYLPTWMGGYTAHSDLAQKMPLLAPTTPGTLGITGMCDEVPEWCLDWFSPYIDGPQIDPHGPATGMARIVRGNMLDEHTRTMLPHTRGYFYQRSANRAGMAPDFGPTDGPNDFGKHNIGFRVVRAAMPVTPFQKPLKEFIFEGVKQTTNNLAIKGPDHQHPYYQKRALLPTPPETIEGFASPETIAVHRAKIDAAGLHPSFGGHNHCPALEVLPNGDVLAVIFTSWNEYEPGMSLMATRLRFGADTWDMPSYFVDMPDACDNAPLLWTEGNTVRLFWDNTRAKGAFPFQWIESRDCGATWSEIHFPHFTNPVGPHSKQPINTVVRDRDGIVYVPSDAVDASSVLWVSRDNFQTWQDPGGRTGGRHTTLTLLKDGKTLLGMGGKSSDIKGYMPKSISHDEGATWEVSATPFPALATNQRPTVLRLASGRLFFCGDFQRFDGAAPESIHERGAYVALSDDDGVTWHTKRLPDAQPHENPKRCGGAATLGYSVARQGQNGNIHILTTMNEPCLHFALNEAWILADTMNGTPPSEAKSLHPTKYEETYPNGQTRVVWHGGFDTNGNYQLNGKEIWFYEDGTKKYTAHWKAGHKVGDESFNYPDGHTAWRWHYRPDGTATWSQWRSTGEIKTKTNWTISNKGIAVIPPKDN